MFRSLRHELDPLDLEILERAFDLACGAIQASCQPINFDSDEGLENILRRELVEIARLNGVSDPETLRDILLARLPVTLAPPNEGRRLPQGERSDSLQREVREPQTDYRISRNSEG